MTFPLFRALDRHAEQPTFIGAPYHGVVVEGELDLTGDGGPLITGYILGDGRVNALSNPNRILPTRSGGQVTADAAVGRVYEPYALVKTGKIYGEYLLAAANVSSFYFDSRGYLWLVEWDISLDWRDEEVNGTVDFTRVLHLAKSGGQAADFGSPHTVTLTAVSTPGTDDGFGTGNDLLRVSDYTTDGTKVLFRSDRGIIEATISDTIDEGGIGTPNPYPYGGGTIAFSISLSVLKTYTEVTGTVTGEQTFNQVYVDQTGALVGSPGSYCDLPGGSFSGVNFCAYKSDPDPNVYRGTWDDYIFAVSYDQSNTVCYWSVSLNALAETSFSPTNITGGLQTMEADTGISIDLELKRNGTTVDTKTATYSRSYIGTADLSTLPNPTLVTTRDLSSSMAATGITTTSDSITESGTGIRPYYVASYLFTTAQEFEGALIGEFVLACQRIENGTDSAADYSPVTSSPAGLAGGFTLEDLSPSGEGTMVGVGVANLQSNKFFGLFSMSIEAEQDVGQVGLVSYNEILLSTGYSADSSQTPDTTVRMPTTTSYGLPLAYNPWTDTWHVSSWDAGEGRWQIVGFV